jgi:cytochrome c-type biogenesis protein CcmF
MLGGLLVKLAFISCLISILCYVQHHRRGDLNMLKYGRLFFHIMVVSIMTVSAVLLYLILTHQFQYTYIWSYSSTDLPLPLLISTFYAGQEGSFMLWALYTAIIGVFLLHYSSRKGYESQVMPVFALIQLSLLLMLIVKNPFTYVWETWPNDVEPGFVPANGRGLNPLLQNYWMVIHPQVLFTGFSAMAVPYAYAVAAMLKRDYHNWIRPATPWIVVGSLLLGTGIMLGGFWAYETLGWGGYWGWDPVENSSLVPWLFSIAAIHTILSQRKSGAFVKTNLALSMLCFIFVLYSTFLTRSGVLGDTSVHSFVDPGMWAYWMLVGVIVMFVGLGFGLLIARMREFPKPPVTHQYLSREFALFLGALTIVAAALFITVGTSAPIITSILLGKVTAVDISYYVTTTLPLGIAIGLLTGIGQLLWWTRSRRSDVLKAMLPATAFALVVTILAAVFAGAGVLVSLFVFGAAFALFANLQVGIRICKGNPKYAGGSIAHIGIAVMFLGFVTSEVYDDKVTLSLEQGKPMEALGYTLTYTGYKPIDRERFAFEVTVEGEGRSTVVAPIMYVSSFNNSLMRNPDVINFITKDFYLAPMALQQAGDHDHEHDAATETISLRKGETKKSGELEITFVDFDFPVEQRAAMLEGREIEIGAMLEVREYGKPKKGVVPIRVIKDGKYVDKPAVFEGKYEFTIASMAPNRDEKQLSTVEIGLRNIETTGAHSHAENDILVVEASVKPWINLVWTGVIILLVGFLVTIVRRTQEAAFRSKDILSPVEPTQAASDEGKRVSAGQPIER